jgi:hypothetical protein
VRISTDPEREDGRAGNHPISKEAKDVEISLTLTESFSEVAGYCSQLADQRI